MYVSPCIWNLRKSGVITNLEPILPATGTNINANSTYIYDSHTINLNFMCFLYIYVCVCVCVCVCARARGCGVRGTQYYDKTLFLRFECIYFVSAVCTHKYSTTNITTIISYY